ncbi:replication/maintenance protein RepL [Bacillus sp. ISL-55]|uniref:replication/maintenance protein RepL n=1 Tax=Bacillus sp. ISL-55 TaxID=2819134 RepID=UPI001BE65B5F|nr:replication/maintenance protein RepL [Bacillus sp. ISL-55]MBT2695424.1 replication/maintenance protein RepL [Bacillus sp. ISL-55]
MSLPEKRLLRQQTEVTGYNSETGEVTNKSTTTVTKVPNQPEFIKLYLRDILYLSDLQTNQSGLLLQLLMRMNYTNEIVLNSHVKKEIAKQLDISTGTIDNNLSKFVEGKILERVGRGVYTANPYLFGKGDWADIFQNRESKISLSIDYDMNGRTFQSVINQIQEQKVQQKEEVKIEPEAPTKELKAV